MRFKPMILASVLLAIASCASVSVHSRTAPNADLARYHTFGWYQQSGMGEPSTVADQDVRTSIARALELKGLHAAAAGTQPDMLVSYNVVYQQKVTGTYGGWGYYDYWGPDSVYTYTEGTIVVDFIDPNTNQAFWRGTASSVVDHPMNPNPDKIDHAIAKVIDRYPVSVVAQGRPTTY